MQLLIPTWDTCFWQQSPHICHLASMTKSSYIHQYNIPTLVQIMACRLFSTKPISEPMLAYCQLDPWEQSSVKFLSKFKYFHSRKCVWECLENGGPFVSASMCYSMDQAHIWTNAGILLIGPLGTRVQWNFNRNSNIFIQENAFENVVWKMVTILSRHQCVDPWIKLMGLIKAKPVCYKCSYTCFGTNPWSIIFL